MSSKNEDENAFLADWKGVFATVLVCLAAAVLGRQFVWSLSVTPKPKPRPKSLTFRVDEIPSDHAEDLSRNLKTIAEGDPVLREAAATIVQRSLAPRDKDFVCATVSLVTHLSGESLCAQLSRAGTGYPYRYSCNFEGITPLYEAKDGADVDIIAVPGLGSHALGSWRSPTSDDVWLRDFLPKDLPSIRVLLYGYDTTLPGSLSKQSIEDLGGTLLERVAAYRAGDNTNRRPIIFVGHSLGGLLIKEALIQARRRRSNQDSNISDISKACFGLLFFGVPNLGLRNDQLRTLVRGQPNEALIHDLLVDNDSEPSNFLKRLGDQFSDSCKGYYRVVSFFERSLSPTIELDKDGKWRKTGPPSLLVTGKSATGTGLEAVADEDNIPLNADHSGLVKYEYRSQGDYSIVRERTKRLADEARLEVAKRFAEYNLYQPQSETTEACLRSLAFDDIESRQNKIEDAAAGTCKWLLGHETLQQWTRQHRGLLWIKGKPGSGKSTILKYALENIPSLYKSETITLSFFFHGRGHELQKTPLGLFRSLLHQLLRHVPGALHDLVDTFEQRRKTVGAPGEKWHWDEPLLQGFLKTSLPKILKRFQLVIFIDALDECGEGPAVKLIQYLKRLLAISPTDSQLSICFSCRYYPILHLDDGLTILLDTENKPDIATYVQDQLSYDLDKRIENLIVDRAQGVFMWAQFVVERVLRLKRQGEPTSKIEAEIKKMPPDLEDIYHGLIQNVDDREPTLRLMQWICFSKRPLTTDELSWAMAIQPDCAYNSLDECENADEFIAEDMMDRRIRFLSCGLVEIISSEDDRIVQFIHQSVTDYFLKRGLLLLDDALETANLVVLNAHYRLTWSCVHYFKLVVESDLEDIDLDDQSMFPFLNYAITSWVYHLQWSQSAETTLRKFMSLFGGPSGTLLESCANIYYKIYEYDLQRPSRGSGPVHIFSRYGLVRLLTDLISTTDALDIDSKDLEYSRTPLSWAAENGNEGVVEILLKTNKVDVDSRDNKGQTPLMLASKEGNEGVVKMLLATGKVDVNFRDSKLGQTPLSWAAENGRKAVVEMLLDTGMVDVDSKDSRYGQTPLSWAAENGRKAVVELLLDTDKVNVDSIDNAGRTPLSWAAASGHKAVVELLLDTDKVNVDSIDNAGRTPLSWAAANGHKAVVEMLLNTGKVDVDSKDSKFGQTPLSWAAENGRKAVVELLLDTDKVNVDSIDNAGRTPLSWAAKIGHTAVVDMLLNTGKVDVNSKEHDHGLTPLSWAAVNGHKAVVELLLDTDKVNVDSIDNAGRAPLSWAAANGHKGVVEILLNTDKVDIHKKDSEFGQTPLSWAAVNGHKAIVKLLLNLDNVNADSRDNIGRTPLSWAAANGDKSVVEMLLNIDEVNVNQCNDRGQSPLSLATIKEHEEIVVLLLENPKIIIDSQDKDGNTPLLSAVRKSNIRIAMLLLEHGCEISDDQKDGLAFQAFAFLSGDQLQRFLVSIGYNGGSDFLGLEALFHESCIVGSG